jgi:sRNA-binding carbon storage regulator CsrA
MDTVNQTTRSTSNTAKVNKNHHKNSLNTLAKKYEYIFDLNPNEEVALGEDVNFGYIGLNNNTRQARFRIKAPTEIYILRLEVFARHVQSYEYNLELNYGQKVKIGDEIELLAIPDKHGRKLVHLGAETPRETKIQKSFKNNTDK